MVGRRETRLDIALRNVWARSLVALVIAGLLAYAWWAAFQYFRDELDLEFLAWPVGIAVAIGGYLVVGWIFRRSGPKASPLRLTRAALGKQIDRRLASLPSISHIVHPLGSPWPKAVVGPTGVYLVEPRTIREHVGYVDGEAMLDGRPAPPEVFGEARRLMPVVRDLLEKHGIPLEVQAVVAVDDATIVPAALKAGDRSVRIVPLNEFPEAVDFGPAETHETVRKAADAIRRWRPAKR